MFAALPLARRAAGVTTITCLAVLGLLGCGSTTRPAVPAPEPAPAPQPTPAPESDPCVIPSGAPGAPVVTFALPDPIDPVNAPDPRNDAERQVFAQLYETLIRIDCTGRLRPGLAVVWSADTAGRSWTFTLRDGARFWGGDPVTAASVVDAWRARGNDGSLGAAIESAVALDERRVVITLRQPSDEVPSVISDPALAVARHGVGDWPEGSGRYWPASISELVPAAGDGSLPRLRLVPAAADPRDALDRGADLLVTSDPGTIAYARGQAEFDVVALPWTETYVLVVPPGRDTAGLVPGGASAGSPRLTPDAVRAEVRPAEPPFWWADSVCGTPTLGRRVRPARRGTDRIVHPVDDPTARELAERLVALAAGRRLVAASLASDQLPSSMRAGAELAYVVPVPRTRTLACRARVWPPGSTVVPLVDARAHAIVRRGVPPLVVEQSGVLRVGVAGSP